MKKFYDKFPLTANIRIFYRGKIGYKKLCKKYYLPKSFDSGNSLCWCRSCLKIFVYVISRLAGQALLMELNASICLKQRFFVILSVAKYLIINCLYEILHCSTFAIHLH